MTEQELETFLKQFYKESEEADKRNEEYRKQIVPCFVRIPLEGFLSDTEKIAIDGDLEIEKVSSEMRTTFFERAASMDLNHYKDENNEFFLTFKYEDQRQRAGGMDSGDRVLLIAIYFALCGPHFIKVNKAQSFARIREEKGFSSLGVLRIPNAPWSYERNAKFGQNDFTTLKMYWPIFREEFNKRTLFALVARRYYFSLIRNQWEDRLIDLIISLEALLLPEDSQNKGAKLAKRLSRLLSGQFDRSIVADEIKAAYMLRNSVVHGEILRPYQLTDLDNVSNYVKVALQTYLLKYSGYSSNQLALELDQMPKMG